MTSMNPIKTIKEKCTGCNKCIRECPIFDAKAPFDDINLSSRGAFFVCLCGSKVGQELSGKVLCSLLQLNHQENLS